MMATLYSPLVYAQAPAGGGYKLPALPSTFIAPAFTPPTWTPYSATAADRTQYWSDSAGTLSWDQVLTTALGAEGALQYRAAQAIAEGITLTLSGSLTLAATPFPTDQATQTKIGAVVTTITATGSFPGGATTYPMKDAAGAWHTLTLAQYKVVAGAIAGYVAALTLIADGNPNGETALPSNSMSLTLP